MNTQRPKNDHVRIKTKSCPDEDATNRRSRNDERPSQPEQPRQTERPSQTGQPPLERRVNSAHALIHPSRAAGGSNPQSQKADATTKRANLISVQRPPPSSFSKTEREKPNVNRGTIRRGDYPSQGNNTTHIRGANLCDEKFRAENRLNCSGRKTDPPSTIRTQLTQKRDVLVRPRNNNSWDSACKRKADREDALENKKKKPTHSHDRGGNAAEHLRRSGTNDGGEVAQAAHTADAAHSGSILPRGGLGRADLGMRPSGDGHAKMNRFAKGGTPERTSHATEERPGESLACTPSDDPEEESQKGGSRRDPPWGVPMKPRQHLSCGSYVEGANDDGNTTDGAIPQGGPPDSEELHETTKWREQRGGEERNVRERQANQREAPLHRGTPISEIREGDAKGKGAIPGEDTFSLRKGSMGGERADEERTDEGRANREKTNEVAAQMASRWNPQFANRYSRGDTDKAPPASGPPRGGSKRGLNATHLFAEIKSAYEERLSDDLQTNRLVSKPPEEAERRNEASHVLQRRRNTGLEAERMLHSNEKASVVKQSDATQEGNDPAGGEPLIGPPPSSQREEAPPPNRRFAAHTLSSNSKNIKTIKGNFKQGQTKGTPASQKVSTIPRRAATQFIKTKNKGVEAYEGERKNVILAPGHQRGKDSTGGTFTRGVSRRVDGADAPGGANRTGAPGGVETTCGNVASPYGHLAARSALPKKEKDKSDRIPEVKKSYEQFRASRGVAGAFGMGRMGGPPGGLQRGARGKDVGKGDPGEGATNPSEEATNPSEEATNPSEEATNPMGEMTTPIEETTNPNEQTTNTAEGPPPPPLLLNTNVIVGDGERIKRHNGVGGSKGTHSHHHGHSRNEVPPLKFQAKATDVGVKRHPREQHKGSSNSGSSRTGRALLSSTSSGSARTARALLSSTSSSSFGGPRMCAGERGKKIMPQLHTKSSRTLRGKDEDARGTTSRNKESHSGSGSRSGCNNARYNSPVWMGKPAEKATGRKRPLVPAPKCSENARGQGGNEADAANTGSGPTMESRRKAEAKQRSAEAKQRSAEAKQRSAEAKQSNAEAKQRKDEPLRGDLTHLGSSKKDTKKSHRNYKDPISEEMERHKREQKKKKNVKSNSIPPRNLNKGRRSGNSSNLFLGGKLNCDGEGEEGEEGQGTNQGGNRASTFRKRSESYDGRGGASGAVGCSRGVVDRSGEADERGGGGSFAKEAPSDNSPRQESCSSASQRERKEISYFEWLAREKRKKEEAMGTGEAGEAGEAAASGDANVANVANAANAANAVNAPDAEASPCEGGGEGEQNPLSDALQDEHYHVMLQPLSAFNLKQNERSYEQEDFVVDKNPIGNGRTGLVFKAIIKKENEHVALKVMAKDTIVSLNIERQVLKEIIIQASLKHKNILQLIAYFEDRTRLFLILELANGGSIRNKMKADAHSLPEEQVALYVYQIADALAYLHKFNIIHRDLKPDNILLHHSEEHKGQQIYKYGMVKIADFGFSCQLKNKRQKRSTFCGTVDYMPPEIINQIPYDCNVDLWCLGIVIFELLVGFPPFTDDTQERIFSQIKELNFHFPKAISLQARDLILKLCSRTADERISAEEVKTHPWVKQFL
ncbi:aurora-related kinase 2, putative [Plasmodium vivax]|uniref:Aurora kinase n=1 Tax=Plasmodium vivax TaxID=5855 RepID=A0A564ZW29_PLAVI|nr:aurora-related kinase 2, putative [Plasmodium vivax]